MMEYLVIGLVVSVGWHIGKILWRVVDEVVVVQMHKITWYKQLTNPNSVPKTKQINSRPYKGTAMGFKGTKEL